MNTSSFARFTRQATWTRTASLLALALVVTFLSPTALAFPDTFRHGYSSCTTCHVSPAGGGLMNEYGRSLSRELMSTWGLPKEERPLSGLIDIPEAWRERLTLGGDVRSLSRSATSSGANGRTETFLMQAQARVAFGNDRIKLIAAVGKIENPRESSRIRPVSPEYYALLTPQESVYVRVGRFEPIYGLRLPDHNLWTRSEIGFVPWIERDTIEIILEEETRTISLSGFQSTSSMPVNRQATGYAASVNQVLGKRLRLGASALNSEGQASRSRNLSVHATIAVDEHAYVLSEIARTWNGDVSKDIGFARLGYEATKGLTPIVQAQFKRSSTSANEVTYRIGGGALWLPRPHWEIMATFEETRSQSQPTTEEALLLLHYYL